MRLLRLAARLWAAAALCAVLVQCSPALHARHTARLSHRPAPLCKAPSAPAACSRCVIRCYLDTIDGVKLYELSWLKDELLTGTLEACGKTIQILPRKEFLKAHECLDGGAILVAMGAQRPHELEYIKALPENVTGRMAVMHLSDETRSHDISHYSHLGAVLRNYWREGLSMEYDFLAEGAPKGHAGGSPQGARSKVLWTPMGYGPNLLSHAALVTPLSQRSWLFAWMGSTTNYKPERAAMLEALQAPGAEDVLGRGYLELYNNFNEYGASGESYANYSLHMYNARFVPCPAGVSTEQWRVWEALEAGAIPVLLDSPRLDAELRPLLTLGLPLERLPTWSALPETLRTLGASDRAAELDARGQQLQQRWADVKRRLRARVAAVLCALGSDEATEADLGKDARHRQRHI